METVFVVQHVHVHPGGQEDIKFIGVYSSSTKARAAVERLRDQPGFRDHPILLDPLTDNEEQGFYIDEYHLDHDHWQEGFITV